MATKVHNLSQNHSNGETSNGNEGSGPIQTRALRIKFPQFDGTEPEWWNYKAN